MMSVVGTVLLNALRTSQSIDRRIPGCRFLSVYCTHVSLCTVVILVTVTSGDAAAGQMARGNEQAALY